MVREKNDPRTKTDALAARRVLRDSYRVLHKLEDLSDTGADWRIGWFTLVSLLRAVGHVLRNIDTKRSVHLEEAVAAAWSQWHADPVRHIIFHQFIELARNLALKEYRIGTMAVELDDQSETSGSGRKPLLFNTQLIDPLVLARDAIKWWEFELDFIEEEAVSRKKLKR